MTAPVAVDRSIAARQQAPRWLADPAATHLLLRRLRTARLDGFDRGPALAADVEAVLARAQNGSRAAARQAERMLTNAWIVYAQALHSPSGAMEFADRSVAPVIPSADLVVQRMATAPSLAEHVRQVTEVNPTYAALRDAALQSGHEPALAARIQLNLDRARMLPGQGRFITVDLASQRLTMFEGGRPVDTMKVVVGKNEMPTPLLAGIVRHATFNPYWNVPVDLVATSIAPNVVRSGPRWLAARRYEVLSSWDDDAVPVDPATIDWRAVADGRTELRVRQKPGRGNMMGAMKFEFPNRHGIYLHDTPERDLFARDVRTFSSGCVRLEDAARLGRWLLGREPVAAGAEPEQKVVLPQGVPVYLTYLTARVENGQVALVEDIYGLDGAAERRLAVR
jgi:murein L,D-transpeptidase YcbB/YkuD